MLGAAPASRLRRRPAQATAIAATLTALLLATSASAATHTSETTHGSGGYWMLAINGLRAGEPNATALRAAKAAGVRAVLTRGGTWSPSRYARLLALAKELQLLVVEPFSQPLSKSEAAGLTRACAHRAGVLRRCALFAGGPKSAGRLASRNQLDFVVVPLEGPRDMQLLNRKWSARTRVVGVVPLGREASMGTGWKSAIGVTKANPRLALAVAPGLAAAPTLDTYFGLIGGAAKQPASAEVGGPSQPTGLAVTSETTSIDLSWSAPTSGAAVIGYAISVDGNTAGSSGATTYRITSLTCGSTHQISVQAVSPAGTLSSAATVTASTQACGGGGGGTTSGGSPGGSGAGSGSSSPASSPSTGSGEIDSALPTTPGLLHATGASTSSVSVAWSASSDNVAVSSYDVYQNGASIGVVTDTSFTATGLACGTTYTFGVDAVDAAGNHSAVTAVAAGTTPCASGGGSSSSGATVYLSPGGSDSSCLRGDSTHPCATPGGAWAVAQAGDTISVANGDYTTGCALTGTKSADTTFSGTTTARFICGVSLPAGNVHVVFDGISMYQLGSNAGASDVTVKNGEITCSDSAPYTLYAPDNKCNAHFSITGAPASNWTFANEIIGPTYDSENCGNSGNTNLINVQVSNMSWTNVTFRDSRYADCVAHSQPQQHTENFYFAVGASGDSSNITFDRCTVYNGPNSGKINASTGLADGTGPDSSGIMLTRVSGGTGSFQQFVMRNCLFYGTGLASVEGNVDANFGTGSQFAYNTFAQGITAFECSTGNCPGGYADLTLKGNLVSSSGGGCPNTGAAGGIKYDHNLWYKPQFNSGLPSKCGATDLVLANPSSSTDIRALLYANYLAYDFSLAAGSQAIDAGDGSSYPGDDHVGATRICGAGPDIGAYERCP